MTRYRQTTTIELLTIQGKAPRVYQAPQPSRTLASAPCWGAWQTAMRGHAWSVKGLTPDKRARLIGEHAERFGIKFALGGDVSAWDSSWSDIHRQLVAAVDDVLFGPSYQHIAARHRGGRPATSNFVKSLMMAFHQSGVGDNSGGNGELHILILSVVLLVV